jgi:hypothetical protein
MIERARPLTLKVAWMMDTRGNKEARAEIAMIKVAVPQMACRVIDWAIQAFGGAGVSDDYRLAYAYATARVLRLADGPDEVHRNQVPGSNRANIRARRASPAVPRRCCRLTFRMEPAFLTLLRLDTLWLGLLPSPPVALATSQRDAVDLRSLQSG